MASSALQCGTDRCPTENLELNIPIRINIEHSDMVKDADGGCCLIHTACQSIYFRYHQEEKHVSIHHS